MVFLRDWKSARTSSPRGRLHDGRR